MKFGLKKTCIYLDQFAVSDMIESRNGSLWFEIKGALEEGFKKGILFCPLSYEHFFETSQKSIENAKIHDSFLNSISGGYCFKPELFITSQLISSRIRNYNKTLKTYFYENVGEILYNEKKFNALNKTKTEFNTLISTSTADLNELRKSTNDQRLDQQEKELLFSTMRTIQKEKFILRLMDLKKNKGIVIRGDKIGNHEVPNWIDLIIDQLLKKHRFTEKEISKLIWEIENFGLENIPTLNIRTTLLSYLAIYSKKEPPNDHIDIMRISTGLPISDIILTDKKRQAELVESNLPEKYSTKMFSGTEKDLKNFYSELTILFNEN